MITVRERLLGGQAIQNLSSHPEQAALYIKGQAVSDPGGSVEVLGDSAAPQ